MPYHGDSSEEEEVLNSRPNSFQPEEDDTDSIAEDYLESWRRRYARAARAQLPAVSRL